MQKCLVCEHEKRSLIEAALREGESLRACQSLFAVSKDSLHRHRRNHLPRTAAAAGSALPALPDPLPPRTPDTPAGAVVTETAAADPYLQVLSLWRRDPGLLKRSQILSRFGDRCDSATIDSLLRRAVASGDLYEIPVLESFLPTAKLRLAFLTGKLSAA